MCSRIPEPALLPVRVFLFWPAVAAVLHLFCTHIVSGVISFFVPFGGTVADLFNILLFYQARARFA